GEVYVTLDATALSTAGDFAPGIGAQSVGGGGGNGGYGKTYAVALFSAAVGGSGGSGGTGDTIEIRSNASSVSTSGVHSPALLAQSIGGGGGSGGAAVVYSAGVDLTVNTAIGGDGAKGGDGGGVFVWGNDATYTTTELDSIGILAQSIGGGGGNGGSALSRTEALPSGELPTISISTAVGGSGGSGGSGNTVTVTNIGTVSTSGDASIGILAQSIGGGGGNGGDASAMARSIEAESPSIKIGVAIGGKGNGGGGGSSVGVVNGDPVHDCGVLCTGTIITEGDNAAGILAQSIGGGGGNGGAGNGGVSSPNLGGTTGTAIDVSFGLGGSGGVGGAGGTVLVNNTAGSLIQTVGSGSQGILAQSIGGGGGNAGGGVAAGSGDTVNMNVSVGGSGGSGTFAQTVTVLNSGTIATGQLVEQNGGAYTTGGDAVGILAQSIGGGGGAGGSSDAAATISTIFQIEDLLNQPSNSYTASVAIGGTGGTGGDGGPVQLTNTGSVTTLGVRAHGILAQSIGGGGGTGGAATSAANSVIGGPGGGNAGTYSATVSVGGSGGAAGDGNEVTLGGSGSVLTAGYGAVGILAQSIGGGGGVGAEGSVNNTTTIGIGGAWDGTGSAGGNGNSVNLTASTITTLGDDAHGIVAQSIGGGGGLGGAGCTNSVAAAVSGIKTTLCFANSAGFTDNFAPWHDASSFILHMGGGAGASGDGGTVSVTLDSPIATVGARSIGVIAQSIGGGGGLVTVPAANTAAAHLQVAPGDNDGASGVVTVTQNATGSIATSGDGAWGILAQSIYGGGGFTGDPSLPVQSLATSTQTTSDSESAVAGNVTVNVAGNIVTTGANAHGVVAQSVGGGGGITNNSTNTGLAFGNSAEINGTSQGKSVAVGGAVTVNQTGGVIQASGVGSIGILAQSTGISSSHSGNAQSTIDITIDGTVIGGTNTGYGSGIGAAGLVLSGAVDTASQVQINGTGSVTTVDGANGTAILSIGGGTVVTNAGTVTGSVDIGGPAGSMINQGTLNSGPLLDLVMLQNSGTVNVAGRGAIGATTLTGGYQQSSTGILAVDIDALAALQADMLTVEDAANLAGTVMPLARRLLPGSYGFLTAFDYAINAATPSPSLLFDWSISDNAGTFYLVPTAHFQPPGVTLTPGEASLASYLTNAWNNADPFFAPVFGYLSQIGSGSAYKSALNALSPEASQAQATAFLNNSGVVLGAALSCPVFTTAGTLLGEDECAWAKVTGNWASQGQTGNTQGFDVSEVMYRIGAQKELAPDWYLGGSFGVSRSSASADNGSSGDGLSFDGSVSAKHVLGPWLFAGSLAVAHGSYDNSRLVALPSVGTAPGIYDVLDSDSSMTYVGGRLRAGYEFTFPNWYIRPYADLDVIYSNAPGYQERGSSGYALNVEGSSQTSVIFSPMVEIGGRYDLDDAILRPFLTFGVSFNSNDSRVVTSSFVGASAQDGSFQTYLNSPDVLGTFSAGLDFYKANGFEMKAEYGLSGGDSFLVQSGSLRFAYHF
ncbi:MAG TPA: autotransporter domain-containing protein, partial [Ancylobacter sp.]